MNRSRLNSFSAAAVVCASALAAAPAWADPFVFNTGNPDGKLATASRPDSTGKIEIESADDFVLTDTTSITSASFTGLLTQADSVGAGVGSVVVEIYRVFPFDSTDPPSGKVPTRVNSPSDVAFDSRASSASELSFATTVLANSFTAANSVRNGINPIPNQLTGGEGPVTGQEVRFDVKLSNALVLPAGHYFFVPQVEVSGGDFYWLSSVRPIVAPGTPFAPDLQSWIRNALLDPDWLRLGTDIIGQTTFNAAFSLAGEVPAVPEPQTSALMLLGLAALGVMTTRARKRFSPNAAPSAG